MEPTIACFPSEGYEFSSFRNGCVHTLYRLGLMVAVGIVLASFMTCASQHLSMRAFMRGIEDRGDSPRITQNFCSIC